MLRRSVGLVLDTLLLLQVVSAALAVVLLIRLAPALERILADNAYSTLAAEEMLAALAAPDSGESSQRSVDFADALQRAHDNVTEEEERPALRQIETYWRRALDGDTAALAETQAGIRELSRVNRASMAEADQEAKALAAGGAWGMVLATLVSFGVASFLGRGLRIRVVAPVEAMAEATRAFDAGDPHRRVPPSEATPEIQTIGQFINALLDKVTTPPAVRARVVAGAPRWVPAVLDTLPGVALILGPSGDVVAANGRALLALAEEGSEALRARAQRRGPGVRVTELGDDTRLVLMEPVPG